MNFRDLRNIEAAFFVPAWFILEYIIKAGCYRALPAWLGIWTTNSVDWRVVYTSQSWDLPDVHTWMICISKHVMHQCYHFRCFKRKFWYLMFWQQIWYCLSGCFFSPILYPFRMKVVRFIIFKFLLSNSHSRVCLVVVPNWRSSLPGIGNNITRYAYKRFFHLMAILRSISDSTWVIGIGTEPSTESLQ